MKFAPGIAEYIQRFDRVMPPNFHEYPLERQREMYLSLREEFPTARPTGIVVADVTIEGDDGLMAIRVYRPMAAPPHPCVVYLHGGGFSLGSLETHDTIAAEIAAKCETVVVLVDYRLAPEHPFPAGLEDCYRALISVASDPDRWSIDPNRIALAGDSSGGNFAAALSTMARDRGGSPLCGQILINPVLDLVRWTQLKSEASVDKPLLTQGEMVFFTKTYVGSASRARHPYASPLLASDFSGLPPAYIMTSEHDPLGDDGLKYGERLRAAGVSAQVVVEPGLVHGCLRARRISPTVAQAFERVCGATRGLVKGPACQ